MKGMPGGMAQLMKQANQMQMKMKKTQDELAQKTYEEASTGNKTAEKKLLEAQAQAYGISLYSVFSEVNRYAKSQGLTLLKHTDAQIHAIRSMQRGGTAQEVAEAICWLLSDSASYVTGTTIDVTGGR